MHLEIVVSLPLKDGNAKKEKRFTDLLKAQNYYGSCLLLGENPTISLVIIEGGSKIT